jgi:hypothetical protein
VPAAAAPVATEVVLVPRDEVAAAAVPVEGATPAEGAAALDALARVGAGSPVTGLTFHDGVDGRTLAVAAEDAGADGLPGLEAEWLAALVAQDIALQLRAEGEPLDWIESGEGLDGGPVEPEPAAPRDAEEMRALGEDVAARAAAAGMELEELSVRALWLGAVKVVVQLDAQEFLAGANTKWLTTLVPDKWDEERPYSSLVAVLAPDGTLLDHGANFDRSSGAWSYGAPTTPNGGMPLPPGPVQLEIRIEQDPPETHAFVLDCQGTSEDVEDPEEACHVVERDWISLLAPVVGDTVCGGPVGVSSVFIDGTAGGVDVSRVYGTCTSQTVGRWEELMGVARE